jgi:hypothetical protein
MAKLIRMALPLLLVGLLASGCTATDSNQPAPTDPSTSAPATFPIITMAPIPGFVEDTAAADDFTASDGARMQRQQYVNNTTGCRARLLSVLVNVLWFPDGYQTRDWVASQTVLDSFMFDNKLRGVTWTNGHLYSDRGTIDTIHIPLHRGHSGAVSGRVNASTGQMVLVAMICPESADGQAAWNTLNNATRITDFSAIDW